MAHPTNGGSSSTSQLNQGKVSNSKQKAASSGTGDQVVKDMLLATNYVKKEGDFAQFDTRLADWYRYGRPAEGKLLAPLRQSKSIDPMDNEEPAALRVFGKDAKSGKSGDIELVPPFTKFILENMTEGHTERAQIVETFGTFYVFMFGERPPTYNFSGTLINAKDINWRSDFQFYYDNYLRGTKCVEHNARLVMTYGGRQIEGFMLNFQTVTDASLEMGVKVSFQVVVTSRMSTLNMSDDFGILNSNGQETKNTDIIDVLDKISGAEGTALSRPDVDLAHGEVAQAMAGGPPTGPVSDVSNLA